MILKFWQEWPKTELQQKEQLKVVNFDLWLVLVLYLFYLLFFWFAYFCFCFYPPNILPVLPVLILPLFIFYHSACSTSLLFLTFCQLYLFFFLRLPVCLDLFYPSTCSASLYLILFFLLCFLISSTFLPVYSSAHFTWPTFLPVLPLYLISLSASFTFLPNLPSSICLF